MAGSGPSGDKASSEVCVYLERNFVPALLSLAGCQMWKFTDA